MKFSGSDFPNSANIGFRSPPKIGPKMDLILDHFWSPKNGVFFECSKMTHFLYAQKMPFPHFQDSWNPGNPKKRIRKNMFFYIGAYFEGQKMSILSKRQGDLHSLRIGVISCPRLNFMECGKSDASVLWKSGHFFMLKKNTCKKNVSTFLKKCLTLSLFCLFWEFVWKPL